MITEPAIAVVHHAAPWPAAVVVVGISANTIWPMISSLVKTAITAEFKARLRPPSTSWPTERGPHDPRRLVRLQPAGVCRLAVRLAPRRRARLQPVGEVPHYWVVNGWELVPGVPEPWFRSFRHKGDPRMLTGDGQEAYRRDRSGLGRFGVDMLALAAGIATRSLSDVTDHMIWNYCRRLDEIAAARAHKKGRSVGDGLIKVGRPEGRGTSEYQSTQVDRAPFSVRDRRCEKAARMGRPWASGHRQTRHLGSTSSPTFLIIIAYKPKARNQ